MIDYPEIIKKLKSGHFCFRDKAGDTLLHSLANCEEDMRVPIEPVQAILSRSPDLVEAQNKLGMTPIDVLESAKNQHQTSNRPFRRLLYPFTTNPILKDKLEKSIYMSFIEQLAQNEAQDQDYRIISSSDSQDILSRPILLLFSGRGNYVLSLINGFGRLMRKTLGIYQTPVPAFRVLSVRYPGTQRDLCNDFLLSKQPSSVQEEQPDSPLFYTRHFVARYLRPLYCDRTGCKMPVLTAMQNMRRLNLIGYSYGSSVIQALSEIMATDMQEYGFKQQEIHQIQSQVLTLHFGAALNEEHFSCGFRTFHILNTQDDVVGQDMLGIIPKWDSKKPLIRTNLKRQKNQVVLLINTLENNTANAPHHISTYCNQGNKFQEIALLWFKSILFNGLSNSIQNEISTSFIPLGSDLEKWPGAFITRHKITPHVALSNTACRERLKKALNHTRE
ncbi:MAG: hypothetical protein SPL08_00770 [Pseudomonadota bacterium]|nr:hypothetical protein [Pseudomonadota bacterium]